MAYIVNLSPKAEDEFYAAIEWYEGGQEGVGNRFEREVLKKLLLIRNNPLLYPVKKGLREAVTNTFPYLIIYKIDEKHQIINVVSVFHTSRHPSRKTR